MVSGSWQSLVSDHAPPASDGVTLTGLRAGERQEGGREGGREEGLVKYQLSRYQFVIIPHDFSFIVQCPVQLVHIQPWADVCMMCDIFTLRCLAPVAESHFNT